ncbi:MAG: helix-turn-helix transcriptional regulator [Lachnospiraceae bacterium]|nr:helix-turn-helix transcriptional regulator [Lachnospiraceae bacterium]
MTRGQHMRACRKAAGLSLRELDAMTGITFVTINRLELDHHAGNIATIEILADALGVSIDEYVGHGVREERE